MKDTKEKEKEEVLFTQLPNPQLFVAINLILDVATPDISKADEIKTIIKGSNFNFISDARLHMY